MDTRLDQDWKLSGHGPLETTATAALRRLAHDENAVYRDWLAEKVWPTSCGAAPSNTMANERAAVLISMLKGALSSGRPLR